MSNTTFTGPVRSENGFEQWDEQTQTWGPISGGGGGVGTEHLTGNTTISTEVQTENGQFNPPLLYWNGVDGLVGGYGNYFWANGNGYGSNITNPQMTINADGRVNAISSASNVIGDSLYTYPLNGTTQAGSLNALIIANIPSTYPSQFYYARIENVFLYSTTAGPSVSIEIRWNPASGGSSKVGNMVFNPASGISNPYASTGSSVYYVNNPPFINSAGTVTIKPVTGTWPASYAIKAVVTMSNTSPD